jgi:hypothetical protein
MDSSKRKKKMVNAKERMKKKMKRRGNKVRT